MREKLTSPNSPKVESSMSDNIKPYWNELCLELSQQWAQEGSNASELYVKTIQDSWFSVEVISLLNKTSQHLHYSLTNFPSVAFTESNKTVVRSRKIRIYPKNPQLANKYLGLSRYWYNQAIAYLRQEGTKASLAEVRKIQKQEHPSWAFDCPQRIREHSISDACEAVKTAKKKFIETKQFNNVSFRSKKDSKQRFGFDSQSLSQDFVFSQHKHRLLYNSTEELSLCREGTRITKENGRWFLILPQTRRVKVPENQRLPFVAIDPGVRTFATFFAPEVQGQIGNEAFDKLLHYGYALDNLYSRMTKVKCKKRRAMKKAAQRLRWRIRDLVDEMHNKLAYFLVTRFDTVFLPTFETSSMAPKLRSKVARSMMTLSHFRFKEKLKAKAEEYSCTVIDVCESYTSKTCSYCGTIQNIGSKKVMSCKSCGVSVDRDINGARGIALRSLLVST